MKLWSIQTWGAYERLLDKGELYGDWQQSLQDYTDAYRWMCEQMEQRGIKLNGRPPMWAWPERPDLRDRMGIRHVWGKYVRLTLEVPDDSVLVSNFCAWNNVTGGNYCYYSDEECQPHLDGYRTENEVVASWDKIFDLELCVSGGCYYDIRQAAFQTIKLDYVKKVEVFERGRPASRQNLQYRTL